MTKGQSVRAVMAFVISSTVVQKSSNSTALLRRLIGVQYGNTAKYAHVHCGYQPRVQSRRTDRQYKCSRYQSGPGRPSHTIIAEFHQHVQGHSRGTGILLTILIGKHCMHYHYSSSLPFDSSLTYGLCAHNDPRVLPGYGGVKMTLSDSCSAVNSRQIMRSISPTRLGWWPSPPIVHPGIMWSRFGDILI